MGERYTTILGGGEIGDHGAEMQICQAQGAIDELAAVGTRPNGLSAR